MIAGFFVGMGAAVVLGVCFLLFVAGIALMGDDISTDLYGSTTHRYVSSEAEVPEVGVCLGPGPDQVDVTSPADVVDCAAPHDAEVAAVVDAPGGKVRPDDEDLDAYGDGVCLLEFEEYVGRSWYDSDLDYLVVTPSQDAWDRGDRTVWCLIDTSGGMGLDGTVRNSHR